MSVPIVTTVNDAYIPGAKALYNSYLKHCGPGFEFIIMVYPGELAEKLQKEVDCLVVEGNPLPPFVEESSKWPKGYPQRRVDEAMYARLMLPHWLPEVERILYLDADMLIVNPLQHLLTVDFDGHPVASTQGTTGEGKPTNNTHQVNGTLLPHEINCPTTAAGLLLFNCQVWRDQQISEKCFELMRSRDLDWKFVVQSVLNVCLCGDFKILPYEWQVYANRTSWTTYRDIAKTLHFIGWNPWDDPRSNKPPHQKMAEELWRQYA